MTPLLHRTSDRIHRITTYPHHARLSSKLSTAVVQSIHGDGLQQQPSGVEKGLDAGVMWE